MDYSNAFAIGEFHRGNEYSSSHPLIDTQVISWKSWVRRCFGGYLRATPHDLPPTAWHCPDHRVYRVPCFVMKLAACCFWNRKFHTAIGGKWTIHTYFTIAMQRLVHPPQTTSWTHAAQPLPLSPGQLVLTIQSLWWEWIVSTNCPMPMFIPPAFLYRTYINWSEDSILMDQIWKTF